MKPSIQTLGQILYSPSQYVIPVFQRNYRWETPQWEQLWESLTEIQEPGKHGNHFMGFLVFVPGVAQPGQHTTFHLIDGQQRLATCSIVLTAIRNVAKQRGDQDLSDEVHNYYLVHPLKSDDAHFRLLPKERDHDSYLALVNGRGDPTGRMADALDYFEERLIEASEDAGRLRQIFDTLCQRFEFMCATLEAENAYNIFKSLNSTGVPLGQSDLIRNFVFMHVPPDDHDAFDRDLWRSLETRFSHEDGPLDEERFSRFFRDYLMSSGRYVPPRQTFATFEARYEATDFSPRDLAAALIESAADYAVIAGDEEDSDDQVTLALARLNRLESSTAYPLLSSLFAKRRNGAIDSGQLARAIDMLTGFILRRFICGETSRGYGRMFVRALAKETGEPLENLEVYLLDRGWPDDHRFKTAFVEFPLYERGYTRAVLETFERARGHKEPADTAAAQVEHILPQTLSDLWIEDLGSEAELIQAEWLHRPGNLTLSAYNLELWNHPFRTKRQRYADSNIGLTRDLANFDRWTAAEIRERGQQLAEKAAEIWIGPKEKFVREHIESAADDEGPGRQELRRRFWAGLNDYLVAEFPDLPDLDARPSWTIRLPSGVRHIGFELRFNLRHHHAGIDVWFWRAASIPVWATIRENPSSWNYLIGDAWEFEQVDGRDRTRMFLNQSVSDVRDETLWPALHAWIGERLSLLYEKVAPRLRDEMDRVERGK